MKAHSFIGHFKYGVFQTRSFKELKNL